MKTSPSANATIRRVAVASFIGTTIECVRYSGASLGYQLASVIAGGLSPLIATGLLKRYVASWPIALFVMGMAAVTTLSVYWAAETAHSDIGEARPESRPSHADDLKRSSVG